MVSTGVKKHPWNISIGLILSYGATWKQALRPNQPVLADLQASVYTNQVELSRLH